MLTVAELARRLTSGMPFGYVLRVLKSMYVDVGSTPALSIYLFMSSIDLFSNKIQQKIS